MCGFIAQLVEHRTGIAEVMGSNPVEALIFFRLLLSNCLNWKIYCDDHTSLSIDHFTVLCLVTWPLSGSEAGGDLVLIQTSLLLLCKSRCSNANYVHFHNKS